MKPMNEQTRKAILRPTHSGSHHCSGDLAHYVPERGLKMTETLHNYAEKQMKITEKGALFTLTIPRFAIIESRFPKAALFYPVTAFFSSIIHFFFSITGLSFPIIGQSETTALPCYSIT